MMPTKTDRRQGAISQTIPGQAGLGEMFGRPFHFVPDVGDRGKTCFGQPLFQDGQILIETTMFVAVLIPPYQSRDDG